MKQLIISIYDSWTYGRVKVNGKRIFSLEQNIKLHYFDVWNSYTPLSDRDPFVDWLKHKYGAKYDSIIICEDGGIEVLK